MGRLSDCELANLADRAIGRIVSGLLGADAARAYRNLPSQEAADEAFWVMSGKFGVCEEIGSSDFSIACHDVAKAFISMAKDAD